MKFSHSERVLHPDHAFTPPPNYYNLAKEKTKILTGSLVGPITAKQIPRFGQSSRFNSKTQTLPGPGSYFKGKTQQIITEKVKNGIVIRQYKQHGYLGGQQRSPSIPYSQLKLDKEDQQQLQQILINQDPNKSALLLKKKHEGYTFPKSPRQFNKQTNKKIEENPLTSIAQYAGQVQRKHRVQFRQQIKKTNQRRAQIINLINPEFVPSLELIEIISKRRTKYTPGPGSYNKFNDQPKLIEPGVSFPSSKRFSQDKVSKIGPGLYNPSEQKIKNISISKSSRNLYDMKNDTDLQHRFYIDPYLHIKKRQDNKVKGQIQSHPFGSQVVRFQKIEKEVYRTEDSYKQQKQSRIQQAVELRLQKLNKYEKRNTAQSQGLLGLSTMASSIQ